MRRLRVGDGLLLIVSLDGGRLREDGRSSFATAIAGFDWLDQDLPSFLLSFFPLFSLIFLSSYFSYIFLVSYKDKCIKAIFFYTH
ncbi:hypothetical protein Hanom_Chr17g01559731 [Helianthus anomalus]